MAATAKRKLMPGRRKPIAAAITLAAIIVAIIFIAILRDSPPDRAAAFPAGELVVGVDAAYPPFALDDGEALDGLDIDLAEAIATELEIPLRFVNIGFYGLYDSLISGEVDLLISALRVDPARMEDVRYTQSYFDSGLVLVSAAENLPDDVPTSSTSRIAYEYASSADNQVHQWEGDGQHFQRLPYELPRYALDALRLRQADAALVDFTTYRLYIRANPLWQTAYKHVTHEPYAIALRKDRTDAWKLVDSALAALKENGELARIIDKRL